MMGHFAAWVDPHELYLECNPMAGSDMMVCSKDV